MDDDDPQDEYTVTKGAKTVLQEATVLAIQLNQTYVTSEHILYCLLDIKNSRDIVIRVLKNLKIDVDKFKELVRDNIREIKSSTEPPILSKYRRADQVYYSPKVKEVISLSGAEALSMGTNKIGTEHLLMGIILSDTGIATSVFRQTGIDVVTIRTEVLRISGKKSNPNRSIRPSSKSRYKKPPKKKVETDGSEAEFEKFATDLTFLAETGALLPVIGRSDEVERVIQTLLRRSKNNPVIIGDIAILINIAQYLAELLKVK